MKRLALALCACTSGVPPGAWTATADSRDAVVAAAREARARGLVPVLYLRADYTAASAQLVALRRTPELRDALRGIAVIAIDPGDDSPYESLRHGYWHSFHALDERGEPTVVALDPNTKDGPCADRDAATCAAWLRPFTASVASKADRGTACDTAGTCDARPGAR
jgi:hypothetical protein